MLVLCSSNVCVLLEKCLRNINCNIFILQPGKKWKNSVTETKAQLPKGTSFDDLTDRQIRTLMNHVNNEKRDSLNGHSPYELSLLLLDNKLHEMSDWNL